MKDEASSYQTVLRYLCAPYPFTAVNSHVNRYTYSAFHASTHLEIIHKL